MKTLVVAVSICLVISRYALLVQAKDIAERAELQRRDVFEDGVIQGENHVHTPVSIREQRDSGSDVRQTSNDTNSEGGDDSDLSVGAIVGITIAAIGVFICPIVTIICSFVVACYAETWKKKITAACTHCVERCRRHRQDSSGGDDSGLSDGVIAGITIAGFIVSTIGVIATVIGTVVAIYLCCKKGDKNEAGQRGVEEVDTREDPKEIEMADGTIRTDGVFGMRPTMREIQLIRWKQGGVDKELRTIDDIQNEWEKLGNLFGISGGILAGYKKKNDPEDAISAVIGKWMATGSKPDREKYPFTWSGFIKALRDIPMDNIADELEKALVYVYKASSSEMEISD